MISEMIILVLLGWILIREVMFSYQTHKMLNKMMSRTFYEYELANTLKVQVKKKPAPNVEESVLTEEILRDANSLGDMIPPL